MSYKIFLKPAGVSFMARREQTILDAARGAGVALRHGCLVGACRLCRTKLLKGSIEFLPGGGGCLTEAEVEQNYFLPCRAVASSDVECELGGGGGEDAAIAKAPWC